MNKVLPAIALALFAVPAQSDIMPGHRLPSGAQQTVRERQIDITRLQADLTIDMRRQTVRGAVTMSFVPLQTNLASVALDSADIDIKAVDLITGNARKGLKYEIEDRVLSVSLPAGVDPETDTTIRVNYEARPNTGLYFFEETKTHPAEAWNYGEGGRHNNWLPLYNDTNDRFSVDFRITVDEPYVVLGNGILRNVQSNRDGSRTYHWVQEEPIPNYLLALNVGQFVEVPLAAAAVGGRTVPLSVWTHEGDQESAAFSFGDTPAMVEFFSGLLGYDYAWPKYDQVTLRNFSGAMETTTMVGFDEVTLNHEGGMLDDGPALHAPRANWNRDDTISHELAHHWFGDLVTCRSLGSLWLNESFATYLHTVWNGHANGENDLTYQRWRYLQNYLDFVKRTGTVRPLEYFQYDASDDMYTSEITYLKGSLVLHLLRNILG